MFFDTDCKAELHHLIDRFIKDAFFRKAAEKSCEALLPMFSPDGERVALESVLQAIAGIG